MLYYCLTLAVRTRLELATPCVTGMYSNQTELPNQNFSLKDPLKASAKIQCFFLLPNLFDFFFKLFS